MPTDLAIDDKLVLPAAELKVRFVRSSGPGGQRVNKVSTKVQLRWAFGGSEVLDEGARRRLRAANPGRITRADELLIECSTHARRDQNLREARDRLATLIRASRVRPAKRRATRPSRASVERRLDGKRSRSGVKATRARVEEG